jgi:hypothetical protein
MKKTMIAAAIAALSVPAFANQQPRVPARNAQPAQPAQPAAGATPPAQASQGPRGPHTLRGRLTLFQLPSFGGLTWVTAGASRAVETDWPIRSITVHPGDRWQICARPSFRDCIVIDRSVPDASVIGIVNQIGSARPAPADAK